MQILGITGGIATGKSAVTQMLADLGAATLSADALARDVLAPGTETTQAVLMAFPDCADLQDAHRLTIDRRALGRLIFADPNARHRLEDLTHPPIIAALTAQAASWRTQNAVCAGALEIPLLFETHLQSIVDQVVVVACLEGTQISRLRSRLGIGEPEARRQIDSQWPLAQKIDAADTVITTDGDMDNTRHQVLAFWRSLCGEETHPHA